MKLIINIYIYIYLRFFFLKVKQVNFNLRFLPKNWWSIFLHHPNVCALQIGEFSDQPNSRARGGNSRNSRHGRARSRWGDPAVGRSGFAKFDRFFRVWHPAWTNMYRYVIYIYMWHMNLTCIVPQIQWFKLSWSSSSMTMVMRAASIL